MSNLNSDSKQTETGIQCESKVHSVTQRITQSNIDNSLLIGCLFKICRSTAKWLTREAINQNALTLAMVWYLLKFVFVSFQFCPRHQNMSQNYEVVCPGFLFGIYTIQYPLRSSSDTLIFSQLIWLVKQEKYFTMTLL